MNRLPSSSWPLLLALVIGVAVVIGLAYVPERSSGEEHPAFGGRYIEGVAGAPAKVNPLFANFNDADADLSALVFSGLVQRGPAGSIQPGLAELPTIGPDGRTYVFQLKDGLTWHDGEALTADDVVFTVQVIQHPDFAGDPQLAEVFRGVTVSAFGPQAVVMVLPAPYAPFLAIGAVVGILPAHILGTASVSQLGDLPFNQQPVGSGPFKLEQFGQDAVLLRRFDQYHGGSPYLGEIELRFYPDDAALLAALTEGAIQGALFRPGLDQRAVDAIDDDGRFVRRPLHGTTHSLVYLNTLVDAFDDDRVRRALQHGLDRQKIIDTVLEGQAVAMDSPLTPGLWSYAGSPEAYAYDRDLAETLLDQAGWTRSGDIRGNPFGQPLRFRLEASDDEVQVALAQEIARQWTELGVQIDVVISGASQFVEGVLLPRQFHTAIVTVDAGPDPDPYPFWHSTQALGEGRNLSSYVNASIDTILENARQTAHPAERAAAYREFQVTYAQLVPAVLLYTPSYQFVARSNVRGMSPGLLFAPSSRFRDVGGWYVETTRD